MEQTIAFIREHGGGGGDGQQCGGGVTASRRDLAAIVGPGKSSTTSAIIEVVKHFNWTYIAVVYSSGKLFIGRPPARQQNQ
jgi:hypothetical protein